MKTGVTYSSKRHLKKDDKVDNEIVNYLSAKRAHLEQKEEPDENHHFGLSVAGRLRQMTQQTASYARMRIMQVLYESEFPASTDSHMYQSP